MALPLALLVATVDCTTKELAAEHLAPAHVPHEVLGDVVQFTLVYNTHAAMGLPMGPSPRAILIPAATIALIVLLLRLLWLTPASETVRRIALGLLIGGATGNLLSRVLNRRGVVDFIDVGLGETRFYVFNVADIGVCCGVVLLLYTMWQADRAERAAAPQAG